jgi:ribosomal protein S18 acetylase RimI-like enzyme
LVEAVKAGDCWVARVEGGVAGYAVLDRSFFNQGFLSSLGVLPVFRRQGVASTLVRHAESICPAEKLFTSTNRSNVAAQKLFETLGFVRSGWIDNLDEGDPEIVYFKRVR